MEEEEKKIGFFKRIKMAIFNLEDYKIFANEKFSQSLKYIFGVIAIVTIILAISTTISFRQEADKLIDYIENDFPDFAFEDNILSVDEKVEAYDEEYEAYLMVDTSEEVSDEQIEEYKKVASETGYYSFVFLNDKVYYSMGEYDYEAQYETVMSTLGIGDITKTELFDEYLDDSGIMQITAVIFIYAIIYLIMSNILTIFEDVIIIGVFGWLVSKICRVKLTFTQNCSLSVYAVTLSFVLSTIYSIVYSFTGFYIEYFSLLYMIIAYIYMVAAIMIIRSDPSALVGQEVPVNDNQPIVEVEGVVEGKTEDKDKENKNDDKKDEDQKGKEDKKEKDEKKETEEGEKE